MAPRSKNFAGKFQALASHLEKTLGLGGKKTTRFIEQLSRQMSPLLENLEHAILTTRAVPLELIQSMFQSYLKQVAKKTGVSWKNSKEIFEDVAHLMRDWIQPEALVSFLAGSAQYYFSRREESEVDEFGMDLSAVETVRPLFQFLYDDYWRVSVRGVENIPLKGRCLLVANHSGVVPYDGAMITLACLNEHKASRRVRFLVEDFVYHFPFMGNFMSRIGAVRACPENATWLLKKNELVLVFPEGVKGLGKLYEERYQLKRFGRGGFIKLAIKNKTPIVPVAVIGAEEIHPVIWKSSILANAMAIPYLPATPTFPWLGALGLIPLPTKWNIIFGKPISFDSYSSKNADNALLVQTLSDKIRSQIQKMINAALKKRKSVWTG